MNREIKFRAFATKNNTMIDLKAITPLACEPGLLEHGDGLFIPIRSDIIIMQYTGIKDKNGKEIYEGDILTKYAVQSSHKSEPFEVKWLDNQAGFNVSSGDNHYYIVIGNIYENPSLITP